MNVILYVFDALRADFLGSYGFDENTSPNLDAFAEDSVRFSNAYATTTWTKASAASIVTSQHPRALDMMHESDRMPPLDWSLGHVLQNAGFTSNAVTSNLFFSPEYGFSGFDEFIALQQDPRVVEEHPPAKPKESLASEVAESLGTDKLVVPHSEYLNEEVLSLFDPTEDSFTVAWSVDTHGPYYLRDNRSYFGNDRDDFVFESEVNSQNREKVTSLYCDMIRYNDRTFGELIAELKAMGAYDESLIIVTADHGESFGDHLTDFYRPIIGHIGPAYEEVINVPLFVKFPNGEAAGRTSDKLVQLTDIYPTITDVCGVETDRRKIVGDSLYPVDDIADDRTVFAETQITSSHDYSAAVRKGRYKLVTRQRTTNWKSDPKHALKSIYALLSPTSIDLFDLEADPNEQIDVAGDNSKIVESLQSVQQDIVEAADSESKRFEGRGQAEVNDQTKAHLQAMGYFQN